MARASSIKPVSNFFVLYQRSFFFFEKNRVKMASYGNVTFVLFWQHCQLGSCYPLSHCKFRAVISIFFWLPVTGKVFDLPSPHWEFPVFPSFWLGIPSFVGVGIPSENLPSGKTLFLWQLCDFFAKITGKDRDPILEQKVFYAVYRVHGCQTTLCGGTRLPINFPVFSQYL